MKPIKFKEWDCVLQRGTYPNGRVALQLNDLDDGMPIATATVNLPDVELDEDEVIIKNYSENYGIRKALKEADIISSAIRSIPTGYTIVTVHKLLS